MAEQSFNADIDSYLSNLNTTTNFGSSANLFIRFISGKDSEVRRSIIRFDISSLPAGVTITSGIVTIDINSGDNAKDAFLRRITQAAWVEDQVTWNEYSTGNSWTTAGGDFTTTDEVSWTTPTATGPFDITGVGLSGIIRDAIDNQGDLVHVLLMRSNEAGGGSSTTDFDSSEGTVAPKLTIFFDAGVTLASGEIPINKSKLPD